MHRQPQESADFVMIIQKAKIRKIAKNWIMDTIKREEAITNARNSLFNTIFVLLSVVSF